MSFSPTSWKEFINSACEKLCQQERWAPEALSRIRMGFLEGRVDIRPPSESLQKPPLLFPGLKAVPWHNPEDHPWTKSLSNGFAAIRKELDSLLREYSFPTHPEINILAARGSWSEFRFYGKGKRWAESCNRCPRTTEIVESISGAASAGSVFFASASPDTHLIAHCGPHNLRIRSHLGLIIPKGCRMRVGSETREWCEGEVLVFDDSFEHEVWTEGPGKRIVLLLDVWHPELSREEIKAFQYIDSALAKMSAEYAAFGTLPPIVP
jgi:aspartate beta-hydroxylase